jgi:hypothetical protein
MNLRMFADVCRYGECVPWKQVEDYPSLSDTERRILVKKSQLKISRNAVLVKFDERRVFVKYEDLAVCISDSFLGETK